MGGKLIEIPFTEGVSGTNMQEYLRAIGITPDLRRRQLRRLIDSKKIIRIIEAHNGLTGLVAENVIFEDNYTFEGSGKEWIEEVSEHLKNIGIIKITIGISKPCKLFTFLICILW